MKTISVHLAERSYPVFIGKKMLPKIGERIGSGTHRKIAIITQKNIADLYFLSIEKSLEKTGFAVQKIEISDGENAKSLQMISKIYDHLLAQKWERNFPILALGGGVVGDVAGFVASTILRGVPFYQIPTTLLAMVDSSIGGKTGINHEMGKNLIGTLYQPTAVFADIETLATLPKREIFSGLAEVVKCGLIYDREFFDFLVENWNEINSQRNDSKVEQIIQRCAEIKAEIVAQDERESGLRRILNFGHTIGHAIEKTLGFGKVLHGEAVWLGMIAAVKLSHNRGLLPKSDFQQIADFFSIEDAKQFSAFDIQYSTLISAIKSDKKNTNGKPNFVLLSEIGKTEIVGDISENEIIAALK